MEMKKISKYIFSLLLSLALIIPEVKAQEREWNGISIGCDLSKFIVPFIDTTRLGWEVSGDFEIIKDLFLAAEVGSQSTNFINKGYTYSSDGVYTRLGADYNFMKHIDTESEDKMFVGLRYGFTTFAHQASNISITDSYWGDFKGGQTVSTWLGANWLEVGAGIRERLFNNFYLGWSARIRIMIGVSDDDVLEPYNIPGYGRPLNNTAAGFNYSIYYKIPLYKRVIK